METFLPATLNAWIGLIVQFVLAVSAAIAFVLRFIRGPLEAQRVRDLERSSDQFRSQGERIGHLESRVEATSVLLTSVDRQAERLHLQMLSVSEHNGRLEERVSRLTDTLQLYHDQRVAEDRFIGERLARIESKMDIPHRGRQDT